MWQRSLVLRRKYPSFRQVSDLFLIVPESIRMNPKSRIPWKRREGQGRLSGGRCLCGSESSNSCVRGFIFPCQAVLGNCHASAAELWITILLPPCPIGSRLDVNRDHRCPLGCRVFAWARWLSFLKLSLPRHEFSIEILSFQVVVAWFPESQQCSKIDLLVSCFCSFHMTSNRAMSFLRFARQLTASPIHRTADVFGTTNYTDGTPLGFIRNKYPTHDLKSALTKSWGFSTGGGYRSETAGLIMSTLHRGAVNATKTKNKTAIADRKDP